MLTATASSPVGRPESSLIVYGIGIGLATAQLTGVVLEQVPVEKSGLGSGVRGTARQFGSALGIAVLGTILNARLGGGSPPAWPRWGASRIISPDAGGDRAPEWRRRIPQLSNQPGG